MPFISVTFNVLQNEKAGNEFKDEHEQNILFILVTLYVLHLYISGKDFNDEQ
jgi:hypothetical protein